jgi:hypothetical protein
LKNLFELAVNNAFAAADPSPTYDVVHVQMSFPACVLRSIEARLKGLEPICTASRTAIEPYSSIFISNGLEKKPFVWDPPVLFHRRYANCDLTNIKHYLGAINLRAHTDIIGGATFEAQGYHVTEMLFQPLALKKEYQIPYQILLFSILCGDLFLVDDVSICNNEYKGEFSTELLEEFANGNGAG